MSPRYLSLYMLSITILRGGHFCSDCGLGISHEGRRRPRVEQIIWFFVRFADVRLTNSTRRTQLLHRAHLGGFSCAPAAGLCRKRSRWNAARPNNHGSRVTASICRRLCAWFLRRSLPPAGKAPIWIRQRLPQGINTAANRMGQALGWLPSILHLKFGGSPRKRLACESKLSFDLQNLKMP